MPSESNERPFLIWDFKNGEVIDPTTGIVVDRIYSYSPTASHSDDAPDHYSWGNYPVHILTLSKTKYKHLLSILELYSAIQSVFTVSEYELALNLRYLLKKAYMPIKGLEDELAYLYSALNISMNIPMWEFIKAVSIFQEIDVNRFRSVVFKITSTLNKNSTDNAEDRIKEKLKAYIKYYGTKIGAPEYIIAKAINVATKKDFIGAFTPKTIAVAILRVLYPIMPRSTVARKTNISRSSLKKAEEFVKSYYLS